MIFVFAWSVIRLRRSAWASTFAPLREVWLKSVSMRALSISTGRSVDRTKISFEEFGPSITSRLGDGVNIYCINGDEVERSLNF